MVRLGADLPDVAIPALMAWRLLREVFEDLSGQSFIDFPVSRNGFGVTGLRIVVDVVLRSVAEQNTIILL